MKQIIIGTLGFIAIMGTTLSCTETVDTNAEYYCPMKCEGDKTYSSETEKCPVCKMDLIVKK